MIKTFVFYSSKCFERFFFYIIFLLSRQRPPSVLSCFLLSKRLPFEQPRSLIENCELSELYPAPAGTAVRAARSLIENCELFEIYLTPAGMPKWSNYFSHFAFKIFSMAIFKFKPTSTRTM